MCPWLIAKVHIACLKRRSFEGGIASNWNSNSNLGDSRMSHYQRSMELQKWERKIGGVRGFIRCLKTIEVGLWEGGKGSGELAMAAEG